MVGLIATITCDSECNFSFVYVSCDDATSKDIITRVCNRTQRGLGKQMQQHISFFPEIGSTCCHCSR